MIILICFILIVVLVAERNSSRDDLKLLDCLLYIEDDTDSKELNVEEEESFLDDDNENISDEVSYVNDIDNSEIDKGSFDLGEEDTDMFWGNKDPSEDAAKILNNINRR